MWAEKVCVGTTKRLGARACKGIWVRVFGCAVLWVGKKRGMLLRVGVGSRCAKKRSRHESGSRTNRYDCISAHAHPCAPCTCTCLLGRMQRASFGREGRSHMPPCRPLRFFLGCVAFLPCPSPLPSLSAIPPTAFSVRCPTSRDAGSLIRAGPPLALTASPPRAPRTHPPTSSSPIYFPQGTAARARPDHTHKKILSTSCLDHPWQRAWLDIQEEIRPAHRGTHTPRTTRDLLSQPTCR